MCLKAMLTLKLLGAMLALWPSPTRSIRQGTWSAPAVHARCPRQRRSRHNCAWSEQLGRYTCTKCRTIARHKRLLPCPGSSTAPAAVFLDPICNRFHPSHALQCIERHGGADMLYFCALCGRYAQARVCRLSHVCAGPVMPRSRAWYTLEKLRAGLHPTSGHFWERPKPPTRAVTLSPSLADSAVVDRALLVAGHALHQVPPQPGGVSWFDQHDPGWETRVDEEADMLEQSALDDQFAPDDFWFFNFLRFATSSTSCRPGVQFARTKPTLQSDCHI